VALHVRGYDGSDAMGMLLFLLLDSVVGEHDVETYIGEISVLPLEGVDGLQPLPLLAAHVDRLQAITA
jgi:hypothetical protein